MSSSTDVCHHLDSTDPEKIQNLCSPASNNSTFSPEVKYIFSPADDIVDEHRDYSHIGSRSKQNYMPHAPRIISAANSQPSGKENRTPHAPRNERVFDSLQYAPSHCVMLSRTNSVQSGFSVDRGPISPAAEERVYFPILGYESCKQNALSEHGTEAHVYFSPTTDLPSNTHGRHSFPVWNNMTEALRPQSLQKPSDFQHDVYNINSKNNGAGPKLVTLHNKLQTNNHSVHHYQQPNVHHPPTSHPPPSHPPPSHPPPGHPPPSHPPPSHPPPIHPPPGHPPPSHPQPSHPPPSHPPPIHPPEPNNHTNEALYLPPPRSSFQQHSRRKTWSPLAPKTNPTNANAQEFQVAFGNNSLDTANEYGVGKRQNLQEDLNMTPPRLAPVSGVLSQNPGQNLIKPIAYKPAHANAGDLVNKWHPETEDSINGSHDTIRLHSMKPGISTLGTQGSPDSNNNRQRLEAFSSTGKQNHSSNSSTVLPVGSYCEVDNGHHSQSTISYFHSNNLDNTHNSSQHNLSNSSHNSIFSNSHNSIPLSYKTNTISSHLSAGDESSLSSEFPCPSDTPDSLPSVNVSRVSSCAVECILQTPSPSDSGICELEAMLREKDAEINVLREVMDRNERAIFQVYEERRNMWLHETQELQNEYERRLKVLSRKSYKTEQVLSLQVYKLQQEQKTLHEEKAVLIDERDLLKQQSEENKNLITHLKQQLEAVLAGEGNYDKLMEFSSCENGKVHKESLSFQEELALKNKELISLKPQLQSFQGEMENKNKDLTEKVRDVAAKTDEVKALRVELNRFKSSQSLVETSSQTCPLSEVGLVENMKPSFHAERDRIIASLLEELADIQSEIALLKEEHWQEKEQWLDEKNKVIRYQKQLQLNYVQMQRKNVVLEAEVEQLTLELEGRDMKLIALSGEESIC